MLSNNNDYLGGNLNNMMALTPMGEPIESESEDNVLTMFKCDEINIWAASDKLDQGFVETCFIFNIGEL